MQQTIRRSLAAGAVGAAIGVAYLGTDLLQLSETSDAPGDVVFAASIALAATVVVVAFAVAAGTAFLAFRYRILAPLVVVGLFAAAPVAFEFTRDQLLVGVFVCGPFVVVLAVAETLFRTRLGRLNDPPSSAGYRALSIGIAAAVVYFGVFALRAVVPLWRTDTGVPQTLPPAVDLAVTLWYVFGISLVLVGIPVALNRRYGLLAPLVGLVVYLLVDLAFVQPAVADGTELVVGLLVVVWPLLASLLAGAGTVEWWLRYRRGEYDEDDDEGGGNRLQLDLEEGLFGDRV